METLHSQRISEIANYEIDHSLPRLLNDDKIGLFDVHALNEMLKDCFANRVIPERITNDSTVDNLQYDLKTDSSHDSENDEEDQLDTNSKKVNERQILHSISSPEGRSFEVEEVILEGRDVNKKYSYSNVYTDSEEEN